MDLVIVESPAKAKTIKKYLGDGYQVMASMGHVRDLPKSKLGVDVEAGFEPAYQLIPGKEELIESLQKGAKGKKRVYLATDPDREGEAISWHLANILGLDPTAANRVTFNEITKSGVQAGMAAPRAIDQDLVDAQQARRILDRIVGYKLSPFLWRKIRPGLSAGRVQSVAVRLIVDREKEITAFVPKEYWNIEAILLAPKSKKPFVAKLALKDGKKLSLKNEQQATQAYDELRDEQFSVASLKLGQRKRTPAPPFITSTLQQEASRRYSFQSRRTMQIAQTLYEGVEVGEQGAVGLITYMRTDSLRISDEAAAAAEAYILGRYGKQYLPPKRRVFRSRASAQDAHEAIRPTMLELTPASVRGSLTNDQYRIYKLIWERFVASQMADAVLNTASADIAAGAYTFRASGSSVHFDGFTTLYTESVDNGPEEENTALPVLEKGMPLTAQSLEKSQHFTQPPARYTEASLIKEMEENGIGRPSTYAPTITTVVARSYVEREGKTLKPTALGQTTTGLMQSQFPKIVDVGFTADMEHTLDSVESGDTDWKRVLGDFYAEFAATLATAEKEMTGTRVKVPDEPTDIVCEKCGRNMVIKYGRFGKFLACPGFPECKNTKRIVKDTGGRCPLCGGMMLEKKSKTGRIYFGCEHNPKCPFMSWDRPLSELCPQCGATLFRKAGKNGVAYCAKEGCGYRKPAEPSEN